MIEVSVIIPCYNHGLYIQEAIDSVLECQGINIEIIIVNDGSTDIFTLEKLSILQKEGFKVLSHENSGPAFSRNAGIEISKGKYILPLDADNKIRSAYLPKALAILNNSDYDIVYSNPIFFGVDTTEIFKTKSFNGDDLFIHNYIDTCSIYRKEVWTKLQGYDINIPYHGNEDWEFWLHAYTKGLKFKHINESLYFYRVLNGSLISNAANDFHERNREYIVKKHFHAFNKTMTSYYSLGKMYNYDTNNPMRASFKYLFKFFKRIIRKADA